MSTNIKIIIRYKNQNIELTFPEAEKLFNDLKRIFEKDSDKFNDRDKLWPVNPVPYYPPYYPPSVPQPYNPDFPEIPWKPTYIYCKVN
jgi:hypothetical protein